MSNRSKSLSSRIIISTKSTLIKFIYSEKATKFCKISTNLIYCQSNNWSGPLRIYELYEVKSPSLKQFHVKPSRIYFMYLVSTWNCTALILTFILWLLLLLKISSIVSWPLGSKFWHHILFCSSILYCKTTLRHKSFKGLGTTSNRMILDDFYGNLYIFPWRSSNNVGSFSEGIRAFYIQFVEWNSLKSLDFKRLRKKSSVSWFLRGLL